MKFFKSYHYLIYPILYVFFFVVISFFEFKNSFVNFGLPGFLAVFCCPRYNTIETQSGEHTIVSWLFFKKSFKE